jgi:hypothetical protein
MLDSRKEEYRELLSALTLAYSLHRQSVSTAESDAKALAVIRDRLYIAGEVEELKVLDRWQEITSFHGQMLLRLTDDPFSALTTDIVAKALKMPESRLRRLFKRRP